MATVEDSSEEMVSQLVDNSGKLNEKVDIPLPVDGLLNPDLAHRFDDFTEKNSAYTLSPATIASNLDKDFETLHPKQLRRVVLGPVLFGRHHREQFDGAGSAVESAQARKRLAADLDHPGGLFEGREARPQGPVLEREGRRRNSTSTPTIWKPRARACRATRSTR